MTHAGLVRKPIEFLRAHVFAGVEQRSQPVEDLDMRVDGADEPLLPLFTPGAELCPSFADMRAVLQIAGDRSDRQSGEKYQGTGTESLDRQPP